MKTSLAETKSIEAYLNNKLSAEERILFEAKLLIDLQLAENLYWQQHTYILLKRYNREQLKNELEEIHQQLFTQERHKSFRQRILSFFL
jgi:hypothetical protein